MNTATLQQMCSDYRLMLESASISASVTDPNFRTLELLARYRVAPEPINELQELKMEERAKLLNTQSDFIKTIKYVNAYNKPYIVGSVSSAGEMSFATNPRVQYGSADARKECARLAKLNPGKLFLFAELQGAEMIPTNTISI